MKTTMLILALSLCAAAQTTTNVSTVTLSGSLEKLMVTNHSGKQVLAVKVTMLLPDGYERGQIRLFTDKANAFPDGSTVELGGAHVKAPKPVSATLQAAIFANGEMRGIDDNGHVRIAVENILRGMRDSAQLAQAGAWDQLQAKEEYERTQGDALIAATARRFLAAHAGTGEKMSDLAYFGEFPATVWQDNSTALAKGAQMLASTWDAFSEWLAPTAHAASDNLSNFSPYPQLTGVYPYNCVTPGSNPCPGSGGSTGFDGISATCSLNGGYTMSVQSQVSVEQYTNISIGITGIHVNPNIQPNTLQTTGSCQAIAMNSTYEYQTYCTSPANFYPTLMYDSTGPPPNPDGICGATACGYPYGGVQHC